MKSGFKKIIHGTIFGIICALILLSLFAFSYLLPSEPIKNHVKNASEIISNEGNYPTFVYSGTQLDNFTDAIILSGAYGNIESHSIFGKALGSFRYSEENVEPIDALKKQVENDLPANDMYSRYWFGTSALTRYLMTFFSYSDIRIVLMYVVVGLSLAAAYLIVKKLGVKYMIAFVISLLMMRIWVVPMSLQYSPAIIISLIAVILVLKFSEKKNYKQLLPYIFIGGGILTAFHDLLTVPLLTLGYPLAIYILIENVKISGKQKRNEVIKSIIIYSVIWAVSYAGMYIFKWALTSIVMNENTFKIAIKQLLFRADPHSHFSRIDTLDRNFSAFYGTIGKIILAIYLAFFAFKVFINRKQYKKKDYLQLVPIAVLFIMPYVWYLGLSNHSFIHVSFTYRAQAFSLFMLLSGTIWFLEKPQKKTRK